MPTKSLDTLEEMVDWESPAFSVTIERGKIKAFAEAKHDDDPVFTDPAEAHTRGLSDVPAPIMFFAGLFHVDKDIHEPDLGFVEGKQLHGEENITFERTPVAGETLSAKTKFTDVDQKELSNGMTMTIATLETSYWDESGDLVVTAEKVKLEVSDE